MSGRRREGLAPNLFPFLAVLICTLGTLILMLALVAQNAGEAIAASNLPLDDAEQKELAQAEQDIDRRLIEAIWQRDSVVKIRDEQTAEIEERRTRQSHLEDHVDRLRDELKQLEAEVLMTQDKSAKATLTENAIRDLETKIADEKSKIETLKSDQQHIAPRVVIVPHKGPNGTDRRPIYIECRKDAVYVQPGNIAIDPRYLEINASGANPLDAALKTIRFYSMQNYGDIDAPYPLVVVRPDGIDTYSRVIYSMKGWDDQYGYELVPDEMKLAYPETDPALNDQVDKAIAQAVMRQKTMVASSGSRGNGNGRGGPGGSSEFGGFRGGQGRAPGDAVDGDGSGDGGSNAMGGSAAGTQGDMNAGRGQAKIPASDLPVLTASNMTPPPGSLHPGRTGGSFKRTGLGGADDQAANAAGEQSRLSDARLTEEAREINRAIGGYHSGGTAGKSPGSSDPGGPGDPDAPVGSGRADTTSSSSYASLGGTAETNPSATSDRFGTPSDVSSKSSAPSASVDPNAPLGGTQATGTTSNNNPAGTAPPPMDRNQTAADQQAASAPPTSITINGQKPPTRKLKRAGDNWALPPNVASMAGTEMVRIIRVQCFEDRLVLLPEGGRGATNVYGFSDGDIDRASLEMASTIRDRIDRWGAGIPGGRWSPRLEVDVVPGGEPRFEQLQQSLRGSGIGVEQKGTQR